MRTHLCRIICKAGLVPWERPFHNLRANRETELMQMFPVHVVTAWIGHTALVGQKHYLQVTDADFQRAAKSGARALQNPVQHDTAPSRKDSQESPEGEEECEVVRSGADRCEPVQTCSDPRGGLNSNQDSLNAEPCASRGYVEQPSSSSSLGTVPATPNPDNPKEPRDPLSRLASSLLVFRIVARGIDSLARHSENQAS